MCETKGLICAAGGKNADIKDSCGGKKGRNEMRINSICVENTKQNNGE